MKKYGAAAALAASFFYLLLSGAGVATVRSFIMLAVMLAAVLCDRQALTLRNLAIAAVLILMVTPHEIMGPSFQMSFAATAALISAYSWLSERQQKSQMTHGPRSNWDSAKRLAAGALLTPLVAGLATTLFSAWHFHRLAPMGLPANLAAMPVVSIIVMPAAVVSALAMPFGLEHWPLKIMGEGVHLMLAIARYFADLSPAGLSGAVSRPAFLTAVAALLLLCLMQTRLRLAGIVCLPVLGLLFMRAPVPDLLVSDDTRLVAHVGTGGTMSVNRMRPNSFTTQTWQRATRSDTLRKPDMAGKAEEYRALAKLAAAKSGVFQCQPGLCLLSVKSDFKVAWLEQLPEIPANIGPAAPSLPSGAPLGGASSGRPDWQAGGNAEFGRAAGRAQATVLAASLNAAEAGPGTTGIASQAAASERGVSDDQQPRHSTNNVSTLLKQTLKSGDTPAPRRTASGKEPEYSAQYLRLIRQACANADLVITASPTPFRNCPNGNAKLLRASELARRGTAEIEFINENNDISQSVDIKAGLLKAIAAQGPEPRRPAKFDQGAAGYALERAQTRVLIRFAVGDPVRPWNRERIFSRAARNMPDFQPVRRPAPRLPVASPTAGIRRGPQ